MTDRYKDFIIPDEELKRHRITLRNMQINTFGELKYVTSSNFLLFFY